MVLQVTQIRVKDVLGVRELSISAGKVTVLKGRNGTGKSSVLTALQTVLGGRCSLATLARIADNGEEVKPEVVIDLEGDGEFYRAKQDAKGLSMRKRVGDSAAFSDVPRPREVLASWVDGNAFNPVAWLTAPAKQRVLMLIEALDLRLDRAEMATILGDHAEHVRPQPRGLAALEELQKAHDDLYKVREGVNRDAKGKRASAEQCRRDAPAKVPDAPTEEDEAGLRAEVDALAAGIARREAEIAAAEKAAIAAAEAKADLEEGRIKGALKATKLQLRAAHESRAAELRAEVERQIAEMAARVEAEVAEESAQAQAALDAIGEACDRAGEDARTAAIVALAGLVKEGERLNAGRAALGSVAQAREHAATARALHAQIDRFERDADELAARSKRITDTMQALERYRVRLAEKLPIPGLEIVGDEIRLNGVLDDQLNTAQRIGLAVEVVLLRARELPVVFVDGIGELDEEHAKALLERLEAAGVQAFVAEVTEDLALVTATRGAA